MMLALIAALGLAALSAENPPWPKDVDVVLLGEIHDNPAHHAAQAKAVARIEPTAIIFEMLTAAQAARITPALRKDGAALEAALEWQGSGWPDFAMYHPIFTASDAAIYGAAVPRAETREVFELGAAQVFGRDAARYGLTSPLPSDQQAAREAMQMTAHCDALPQDALPGMVAVQRLRDARLAQIALQALEDLGPPVVAITGNGHARKDWGVPVYLQRKSAQIQVFAIGMGEDGQPPDGSFDALWLDSPAPERPDPCLAFTR